MKKNHQNPRVFAHIAARELHRAELGAASGGILSGRSVCGGTSDDDPRMIDDCTID
ncbi:hypothetical protein [Haliangium sp.]|uniref:hypothetical protein n=1 Tax=Haliangium sp. TaxID=2663208 RepID=UPI003D11E1DE